MDLSRLTTETRNTASAEIDRLSPLEIVRLMNAQDAEVPAAIAAVAEPMAAAMRVIADRLRNGGRLIYVGAGTSGRLGVLDAAECPPTFNSRPWQVLGVIAGGSAALTRAVEGAEDLPEQAVADLQQVRLSARDAVVGIATSGRTPYVLGGLRSARACGAVTIGITCNQDSELARISDHLIVPVVGPEVITGSTRLKAGTATKLVLNTLSTGAMVLLGKTYGNLMVDLQCTNQKLADRSRRIVGELAEVDPARAEQLLDACHGDTKTAIVAARRGLSPREAQAWLTRWDGHLRDALHQPLPDDRLGPDTAIHQPQPTADLLLAIDGGGSKTACRLVEFRGGSSRPLGESGAGPSNPNTVGWAAALDNIEHAVTLAFSAAGLPRRPAAAACLAIAGGGREDHRQRILRWAETRELAEQINVTHDALPVLAAGTPRGHGIAIIAGTGSIAFGRDPAGRTARSGGRGYLFGDQGSGYAIARAGLQAAAEAVDHGTSASGLVAALLAATDTRDFEQLSQLLYRRQSDQAWLASLATAVCQAALDGDTAALAILDQAADALVAMAQVVLGSLGENPAWDHPPIALGGSMLTRTAIFRQRVIERLQRLEPAVGTIRIVEDPLSGVLRLAEQTIRLNPLRDHPPDKPASTWDGPEET